MRTGALKMVNAQESVAACRREGEGTRGEGTQCNYKEAKPFSSTFDDLTSHYPIRSFLFLSSP
jgi:hypothetical protein